MGVPRELTWANSYGFGKWDVRSEHTRAKILGAWPFFARPYIARL
jgi:hypothetical protein